MANLNTISVLVPKSPFLADDLRKVTHCLAVLDVAKLMQWWPGTPHSPNRDSDKVRDIQRSLDWKRVADIAAYLLQDEIRATPTELDECFRKIYEPRQLEPGREWPPRVRSVTGYEPSEYPVFSNVLIHVNGAKIKEHGHNQSTADLTFTENRNFKLAVIDGQHRINGAYFALFLLKKRRKEDVVWEIPAEIFVDLDAAGDPPRRQAQVFIDVNFYQKKVDRSLVADLFPTTRSHRDPLDAKERAQDIGRRLMLETGPLRGMVQIPGIKYGVKDVVTLATLVGAIERVLPTLDAKNINSLEGQTQFLANCLEAWLDASGRREEIEAAERLNPENVAYQGRILVSFIDLIPACLWHLKKKKVKPQAQQTLPVLTEWLGDLIGRAGFLEEKRFIGKSTFKSLGYVASGGIGRFRDRLWAAVDGSFSGRMKLDSIADKARANKALVHGELGIDNP